MLAGQLTICLESTLLMKAAISHSQLRTSCPGAQLWLFSYRSVVWGSFCNTDYQCHTDSHSMKVQGIHIPSAPCLSGILSYLQTSVQVSNVRLSCMRYLTH